jgi:hypothetical protein
LDFHDYKLWDCYYVSNIIVLFGKKDGPFVSSLVTEVPCKAWQYLLMDAFLFHVELIPRKYQPFLFFHYYIKLTCLVIRVTLLTWTGILCVQCQTLECSRFFFCGPIWLEENCWGGILCWKIYLFIYLFIFLCSIH